MTLAIGTRVYVTQDFLGPDEHNEFEWYPLAAEEGTIRAAYPNDHDEIIYDIEFDLDPQPNETWPYLENEVREIES